MLGLAAANEREDLEVEGIDISPAAVAIAQRLTRAAGLEDRVTSRVGDALENSG